MQILKSLSLFCAAAVSVNVATAQSDNDAQNKAREAMRQKLDELQRNSPPETTPAQVAPAPKPVPAPKVKKTPKPAPVKKAPAPVETQAPRWTPAPSVRQEPVAEPTPAPAPQRSATPEPVRSPAPTVKPEPAPQVVIPRPDSEAIAKAREAMREKMNALEAQQPPPAAMPPAAANAQPTRPVQPAPVVSSRRIESPAATTPPPQAARPAVTSSQAPAFANEQPVPAGQADMSPARRELERRQAELAAQQAASATRTEQPRKKRKQKVEQQVSLPSYQPLEAPPLPISSGKQHQLAELLRRYQADELTPSQYHQERAKILAQP